MSEIGPQTLRLLELARGVRPAPTAHQRARVRTQLEARVATAPSPTVPLRLFVALGVASAVIGAGAWLVGGSREPPPPSPVLPVTVPNVAPTTSVPKPLSVPEPVPLPPSTLEPRKRVERPTAVVTPIDEPPVDAPKPLDFERLMRADVLLRAGQWQAALDQLDAGAGDFQLGGRLAEEAEALRAIALCQGDRKEEGRARVETLREDGVGFERARRACAE